jgi:hypothetical protein
MKGGGLTLGGKGRKEVNILRRRERWSKEEPLFLVDPVWVKNSQAVCELVLFGEGKGRAAYIT